MAIAARTIRRSLKEDLRVAAERRGEMDLRFAKWEVRHLPVCRDADRLREWCGANNTSTEWQADRVQEPRQGQPCSHGRPRLFLSGLNMIAILGVELAHGGSWRRRLWRVAMVVMNENTCEQHLARDCQPAYLYHRNKTSSTMCLFLCGYVGTISVLG